MGARGLVMEDWLTIKEAAEILRLSEHTVRDQVRDGKIPSMKLGHRTVRVRRVDIEALLPPTEHVSVPALPIALPERKLDRAGVGHWLLSVLEGNEGDLETKISRIQAFAYGLIAE
jgi:excisionase family DNA binding protein